MAENLAGWFARKLGTAPQPQQQYPVQQYQQPQYPQQYQQPQQQQYSTQPQPPVITDEQLVAMKRAGQITFSDGVAISLRRWAGNRRNGAARFEHENCPECDSPNFFTRSALRKRGMNNAAPAPMCMNCGFDGMHDGLVGQDVPPDTPVWGAQN